MNKHIEEALTLVRVLDPVLADECAKVVEELEKDSFIYNMEKAYERRKRGEENE